MGFLFGGALIGIPKVKLYFVLLSLDGGCCSPSMEEHPAPHRSFLKGCRKMDPQSSGGGGGGGRVSLKRGEGTQYKTRSRNIWDLDRGP